LQNDFKNNLCEVRFGRGCPGWRSESQIGTYKIAKARIWPWLDPLYRETYLGGVPREQKMLTGHLPRVIYHQVC